MVNFPDSKMDPWTVCSENEKEPTTVNGEPPPDAENQGESSEEGQLITRDFEDTFNPFVKLPDSSEYLASLEKRLSAVQRGSKKGNSVTSKEILQSLEQSHQSCMVNLLTDTVRNFSTNATDDEIKVNPILKIIAPEKQAIGVEELVHLVKADELSVLLEDDNNQQAIPPECPESLPDSSKEEEGPAPPNNQNLPTESHSIDKE